MPPLNPHAGLPGSKAIPDTWTATHAPIVTGTLDCTVTISPAGAVPAWNETTGKTETPSALPVYEGPASVGLVTTSDGRRVESGDDQVDERIYEVKLPAGSGAAVTVDHVVTVQTSPNTALVGARLRVSSVALPGREFSRVLYATLTT